MMQDDRDNDEDDNNDNSISGSSNSTRRRGSRGPQYQKGRSKRRFSIRSAIIIVSFMILSAVVLQTSILESIESHLVTHMIIEHALFFLIGALSVQAADAILRVLRSSQAEAGAKEGGGYALLTRKAYHVWSKIMRTVFSKMHGLLWIGLAVVLMAFWHMPAVFDLASMYESVHVIQHVSFIIVGASAFIAIRAYGGGGSLQILLLIIMSSMMGFTGLLFSISSERVYALYSTIDHNIAGDYMIIISIILLVVGLPLYLIKRTLSYVNATTNGRNGNNNI